MIWYAGLRRFGTCIASWTQPLLHPPAPNRHSAPPSRSLRPPGALKLQDSVLVGMPRFSLGWVLTAAYLFSRHLSLLVWPHPLGVDWSYLSVAPVLTIWDARNLWSLAVLGSFAGLTLFAIRRSMAVPQVASGVKRAIAAGIDKVPTPLKMYVSSALIAFVASAVDGSTPSSLSTTGIASPGPSISAPPQSAFKSTRKRASSTASTSKKASRAAAAMLAEEISSNGASSSTSASLDDPARLTTPSAGAASDRASAISSAADAAALPLPLPVVLLFSLLSILICMLPASSLLFDVGFTIAERVMYTPSIAAGLTLATLIAMFEPQINSVLFGSTSNKSNRAAFAVVLASLFGGLMYRSYIEALHWNDESSNWGALLAVNPRNAKAWYEIGHQAQLKGDYHSALLHYRTSIDTYNSVVAEIESTANAGGLFSSPYPGISDSGSWARLYPDPYVNSVMIYLNLLNDTSVPLVERQRKALGMLQEMLSLTRYVPADKSSLGSKGSIAAPAADQLRNTSALLSHLHSQCISAPWGSEDGAAAGKWDSQTSCVLSGGSGLSVDPRFTRVMDRTVTTALSHLNRAIVGGLVEGGRHFAITQDAAEQILLATTLLSRISPAIAPESAPLVMGDELTKRSAYNLAIVWYEKMLRWQLQRVSAAGDDDAAAAPASASNSESGSTAAGLVASYEDLAAAVRSQMQWKFVPIPKPSRIEISEEVLAAADASPFAGMALRPRDAHALYQNLKVRVLPPARPASPSLTATSAASSSSGSASHLDGMYCLDIPHAPGTRHGGPPSMTAARSLIPSGAATASSTFAAFDCATPTDIATPCGRALIAASKSAEAAASAFREARDRSLFASFRPCTCESSTMEVRGVQQPQQSLRVCAAPSVALPMVADPPHSHYISHFGAAQSNPNATCAPARCAKRYPDVATGTAAAAFAAADRLVLSDFVSLDMDTVTLPQALYLARRAEVLTQAWINSSSNATAPRNSNPSAASGSTLSNSVKQALYAGSGPLSALLHICGCASAPGVKL